jgi:hypothetical protein
VKVGMDFMPLETTRKLNFPISCNVMPKWRMLKLVM